MGSLNCGSASGFRTDIQALRAIAVLLVVGFHVWPTRISGGYVGVDVFFVISGYLITAHLLREVAATKRVDLPTFYARRARRLLPAANLTLVAVCLAAYLWMPPSTWPITAADMAASTLYAENWMLVRRSVDYLAQDEPPSPLQHFWSLAVEEQFYLGWPLLVGGVAALWRRYPVGRDGKAGCAALPSTPHGSLPPVSPPRRAYALPMALACGLSFVTALIYARTNPAAGYFMTHVRLFELGGGGLLAVWVARGDGGTCTGLATARPTCRLVSFTSRTLIAAAGLAAIGGSGYMYTTGTPFPGSAALLPVLGTVAVIVAGEGDGPDTAASPIHALARPLAHPWLQYFGEISYSLYLAHWPVIVVYPFATGRAVDGALADGVTVLVLSLTLAHACKHRWEDRFRWAGGGDGRAGASRHGYPSSESAHTLPTKVDHAQSVRFVAAMTVAGLAGSAVLAWLASLGADRAQLSFATLPRNDTVRHHAFNITVPSGALADAYVGDPYIGAEAWVRDATISSPPPVLPLSEIKPPLAQVRTDRGPAYTVQGRENCIARVPVSKVMECKVGQENANASAPHVVLIGDSHAVHWLPALTALADARGWRATGLTKSSCLPTNAVTAYVTSGPAGRTGRPYTECRAWTDNVVGWVLAKRPELVLLSASPRHSLPSRSIEDSAHDLAAGIVEWVDQVVRVGIPVAAINHTPFTKINVPLCLGRAAAATEAGGSNATTQACTSLAVNALPGHGVLSRVARQRRQVHLLDFGDAFCSTDGSCPPVIGNVAVYRDAHHMTATYSRTLAPALGRRLEVAVPSLFTGARLGKFPVQGGAVPP
jgi:peptidoglycan/LPS O-acetylase OafA/YrhL